MKRTVAILILLPLIFSCRYARSDDFNYMGPHGPEHWAEKYNDCSGKFQSPININLHKVRFQQFHKFNLTGFDKTPIAGDILNNAHTVLINFTYASNEWPIIKNGPFYKIGAYQFAQLHFHWGANDSIGSEDRINNQTFPAELHMVFHNIKYNNLSEALMNSDGVAVLAFFYSLQENDNPKYAHFVDLLEQVHEPGSSVQFNDPPTLMDLMSDDIENYFTYTGSLTTPPCTEHVTWIDFAEPVKISEKQISAFRHVLTKGGVPLISNYRPLQPLNNRTILQNYVMEDTTEPDLTVPFFDIVKEGSPNMMHAPSASNALIANSALFCVFILYFYKIILG